MGLRLPDQPLLFWIPQGQREIAVTVIPGEQVRKTPKPPRKRAQPLRYQDDYGWVAYNTYRSTTAPLFGLRFQSEADLLLAHKFLLVISHEAVIYGYVRLTKADTDALIAQHEHTTVAYSGSPGISSGQVLTFSTGHILLRNPHVENLSHGSLFTDYQSFLVEQEAMREFMSHIE
jgi:hypothetical protein